MGKPFKIAVFIVGLGYFLYNVVNDKDRAKFDVEFEAQKISLTRAKNEAYYFFWEMLGAYQEEVAKQTIIDEEELHKRELKVMDERDRIENDRGPAFDDSHKWDKFVH